MCNKNKNRKNNIKYNIRNIKEVVEDYDEKEDVLKILGENILDRNEGIKKFLNLIYFLESKSSINIDGDWGTGKTFFVRQCQFLINALSELQDNDEKIEDLTEEKDEELKKTLIDIRGYLKTNEKDLNKQMRAIYYNAYEYDSSAEPLLTIIFDILRQNKDIDFKDPTKEKGIINKVYKVFNNLNLKASFNFAPVLATSADPFLNNLANLNPTISIEPKLEKKTKESMLDIIDLEKKFENNFKEMLEGLLGTNEKLIIFIDELDRCNPKFAVKLLERVKTYFKDDKFIFVFSTNLDQLQHTIKKYYGLGFDAYYYLQKFFNFYFELPEIDIDKYIDYYIRIIPENNNTYRDQGIREILKIFNFNFRDCERYFNLLKDVYSIEIDDTRTFHGKGRRLFTEILFPLLLALKIKKTDIYKKITSGNGKQEFIELCNESENIKWYINYCLSEQKNDDPYNEKITFSNNDLEEIYDFTFKNKEKNFNYSDPKNNLLQRVFANDLKGWLSYLGKTTPY